MKGVWFVNKFFYHVLELYKELTLSKH